MNVSTVVRLRWYQIANTEDLSVGLDVDLGDIGVDPYGS